jgi:hypothetical protein
MNGISVTLAQILWVCKAWSRSFVSGCRGCVYYVNRIRSCHQLSGFFFMVAKSPSSRSSVIDIATTLRAGRSGARIPVGRRYFSLLQKRQDRLWVPLSLLPGGYRRYFLGVKRPEHKLTTHFHIVPRLSMNGAVPLLSLYALKPWIGRIW